MKAKTDNFAVGRRGGEVGGSGGIHFSERIRKAGLPPVRARACCCYACWVSGYMPRLHRGFNMGVRVARGLFRLWLVFSVLWIAGVGAVTWRTFPVNDWTVVGAKRELSDEEMGIGHQPQTRTPDALGRTIPPFDPSKPYVVIPSEKSSAFNADVAFDRERRAAVQFATLLALAPPFFVLALGSALRWALLGFRT